MLTSMKPLLPFLVALVCVGVGCADKLDVTQVVDQAKETVQGAVRQTVEQGVEKVTSQKINTDIGVDFSEGGATFTDPKTGKTVAVGAQVTVPADFPADMPQYPGAVATSLSFDAAHVDASLLLMTPDTRAQIREWYATAAAEAGWTQEEILDTADRFVVAYAKTGATLTVTILPPNLQKEVGILLLRQGE